MIDKPYGMIIQHHEAVLVRYGDTHLGAGWDDAQAAEMRYRLMLGLMTPLRQSRVSLLDFGCGTSRLLDVIQQFGIDTIDYHGLDLSPTSIQMARRKHPDIPYFCLDILEPDIYLPSFDYIVMNGVFMEKLHLSTEDMFAYVTQVLQQAFMHTKQGLAFNLRSPHADTYEETLFYPSLDRLATFVTRHLSPHFMVRHDYGLPEYTVHIYR